MIAACCAKADRPQDAWRLVEILHEKLWHCPSGPIRRLPGGKPVFVDHPERWFSLSHTHGMVLAVAADTPCGCDVEAVRDHDPRVMRRVASDEERRQFEFLELWTLKESYFKLEGDAPFGDVYKFMASSRFSRKGSCVQAPRSSVACGLYRTDNYRLALACEGQSVPSAIEQLGAGSHRFISQWGIGL